MICYLELYFKAIWKCVRIWVNVCGGGWGEFLRGEGNIHGKQSCNYNKNTFNIENLENGGQKQREENIHLRFVLFFDLLFHKS